ncbi:hypothetical protein GWI33_013441 [Rhynchophorus ferrugineus]|uniref:Uncharacterized protein n=1 Tax=Rhynchophorus ferrugineus TaxID=354439 RepID=A0A834I3E5_RHYFE|nr:hypothetical protein GWI33_013441 [Rhynchophorus ferrugineus]
MSIEVKVNKFLRPDRPFGGKIQGAEPKVPNKTVENHLERIVERPGKIIQRHPPLNRMVSGSVTAQDMIDNLTLKPSPFTTIFELREGGTKTLVSRPSSYDLAGSTLAQIAGYAACTGQILNIGDVGAWLCEKHSEGDAETARTILCMPIINGQRTLIAPQRLENILVSQRVLGGNRSPWFISHYNQYPQSLQNPNLM